MKDRNLFLEMRFPPGSILQNLTALENFSTLSSGNPDEVTSNNDVDSDLYLQYVENRSVSVFAFHLLTALHAILAIIGASGNILVLLAVALVKSETHFFLSNF